MRPAAATALVPLLLVAALGASEAAPSTAAPVESDTTPPLIADHTVIADELAIPESALATARALPAMIAHPPGNDPLVRGLTELSQAEPARHALRTQLSPGRTWFSKGGVGHYQVGSGNKNVTRMEDFAKRFDSEKLDGSVKAAMLDMEPGDFPRGRSAEMVYTQYAATMSLNLTDAKLKGTYTETLVAPRVVQTGNASFLLGFFEYPIELPNVELDHYAGQVTTPAGGFLGGDDGFTIASVSPRDPRLALNKYAETMASLEKAHPTVAFVFSTVPLATRDNYQRNWYNQSVRTVAKKLHRPLFDAAAVLSHSPDGTMASDDQGERVADDWADKGGAINAAGRERLARAWWYMMARLGGWKPEGKGDAVQQRDAQGG
jgi:hypothetical protein